MSIRDELCETLGLDSCDPGWRNDAFIIGAAAMYIFSQGQEIRRLKNAAGVRWMEECLELRKALREAEQEIKVLRRRLEDADLALYGPDIP